MAIPTIFDVDALATIIANGIKFLIGSLIARSISVLGIAVITYNINSTIGNFIKQHFITLLGSGSGDAMQIAAAIGLHSAANIIFSAYIASLSIRIAKGVTSSLVFGNSGG